MPAWAVLVVFLACVLDAAISASRAGRSRRASGRFVYDRNGRHDDVLLPQVSSSSVHYRVALRAVSMGFLSPASTITKRLVAAAVSSRCCSRRHGVRLFHRVRCVSVSSPTSRRSRDEAMTTTNISSSAHMSSFRSPRVRRRVLLVRICVVTVRSLRPALLDLGIFFWAPSLRGRPTCSQATSRARDPALLFTSRHRACLASRPEALGAQAYSMPTRNRPIRRTEART